MTVTVEQDFQGINEIWGAGQQQVRDIRTKLAVYHLNLWMHTLVELWAGTAATRHCAIGATLLGV